MYILFDIGGTNTRIAASRDGKTFGEPHIFKTPRDFEDGVTHFVKIARVTADGEKINAISGGAKGPIDTRNGILVNPPNLPDWKGKPFKKRLEEELDAKLFIANDTAIVGLGEARVGAGAGEKIVAYITVSTGTNGVRIVDGRIDPTRQGFEIGHQVINMNERLQCTCAVEPTLGHPEAYITGSAFERRFGEKAYEVTDEKIWEETARVLAIMLHNVLVSWSPDIIVVGGSMIVGSEGPTISLERTQEHLDAILTIFPKAPPIKKAALGAIGGLHGALTFCTA